MKIESVREVWTERTDKWTNEQMWLLELLTEPKTFDSFLTYQSDHLYNWDIREPLKTIFRKSWYESKWKWYVHYQITRKIFDQLCWEVGFGSQNRCLYVLNISKQHVFTTWFWYLIGSGQKNEVIKFKGDLELKLSGRMNNYTKHFCWTELFWDHQDEDKVLEHWVWFMVWVLHSSLYTVHSTVSWQPRNGSAFCRSGPDRVENLTHQNLCLVAAYSHKHCTTKQQ